jgi:hypothetical protein
LNSIRQHNGKFLLIAGVGLMWLILLGLFRWYGYGETWALWKAPAREPIFLDFRLIPGSAESFAHGYEPSIENPYDPTHRIFNYPAFWRLFFYTGITQNDTIWIVVLMILLFFSSVIVFPQNLTASGALWMLLIVFSPAAMLLYERGNVDLIVFVICAVAVIALDCSTFVAAGILVFGAVVKMFPLFGLTIFLKEPKRRFILIIFSSVLFMIVYGLLTFKSELAAWNTTLRSSDRSYGTFVFIYRFYSYIQVTFPNLFSFDQWRLIFELCALGLIGLAVIFAFRERQPLWALHERNLAAFQMGASIYLGTFMLGNNWDYRLAFLVLVIPQLAEWSHVSIKKYQFIALGMMIGIVLSCWYLFLKIDLPVIPFKDPSNRSFVFDELINWLLVPGFTYLLVASSPEWLRQPLQNLLGVSNSVSPEVSVNNL